MEHGTVPGMATLQRDALRSVIHDLGGILAAMSLRLEVLAHRTDPSDVAALRGLVEQTRQIHRALRLVRGPEGSDALAPTRQLPTAEWWAMVAPMTAASLPRGVTLEPVTWEGTLSPREAHALTLAWLAACRDLGARSLTAPAVVRTGMVGDPLTFTGTLVRDLPLKSSRSRRWRRLAERCAAAAHWAPAWSEDEGWELRLTRVSPP